MKDLPRPVFDFPIILILPALPLIVAGAVIYFILQVVDAIIEAWREAQEHEGSP